MFRQAQLELGITDLQEELESDERSLNQAKHELEDLREKILAKTDEKDRIVPQFEEMVKQEKELERRWLISFVYI